MHKTQNSINARHKIKTLDMQQITFYDNRGRVETADIVFEIKHRQYDETPCLEFNFNHNFSNLHIEQLNKCGKQHKPFAR